MRRIAVTVMCVIPLVAACQKREPVQVVSSPYASGQRHSEPVVFNGKPYTVSMTFQAASNAYDVVVAGKSGRPLGGEAGDRKIVEQIGTSTVRHYACAGRTRGNVVPGTSQHTGKAWQMRVKCG